MTTLLHVLIITFYLFCQVHLCAGQGNQSVHWYFKSDLASSDEGTLTLQATIVTGWHLYSQFIKDGGPIPTHFLYDPNDFVVPVGKPEEKGKAVKYHDDIYDMDITWYSGEVSFIQKVKFRQPSAQSLTTVTGTVEYMICNDHLCVPNKQAFTVVVRLPEKTP